MINRRKVVELGNGIETSAFLSETSRIRDFLETANASQRSSLAASSPPSHRKLGFRPVTLRYMRHFARAGVALMMSAGLLLYGGAAARADNELAAGAPTFYALAPGNDSSVAALAHMVANTLQALFDRTSGPGSVWVVPRLSWGPNDLGDQCLNDPNLSNARAPQTLGGLILEGTNTATATDPFFLVARTPGWAKASASAQMVSCQGAGFKKPTITWISGNLTGTDRATACASKRWPRASRAQSARHQCRRFRGFRACEPEQRLSDSAGQRCHDHPRRTRSRHQPADERS